MKTHRPFFVLLTLYLLLASLYSVVTPLFEASDELWHYPMVKYIADSGFTLPVQDPRNPGPMRQEGSQPPLYYLLSALLVSPLDRYDMDEVRHLNPHPDLGVLRPDGNVNIVVHDPVREGLPWRGTVLAAHVVRFFSVLLGTLTLGMTYWLALELFPGKRAVALGAAALTAFNPMFLFISGSINNDNLSTALASVLLLQIVRLVNQQTAPTFRQIIGIGVVAGCGDARQIQYRVHVAAGRGGAGGCRVPRAQCSSVRGWWHGYGRSDGADRRVVVYPQPDHLRRPDRAEYLPANRRRATTPGQPAAALGASGIPS